MPTLIDLDGFAHQTGDLNQAGSGFIGMYDASPRPAGITFDTSVKRTSGHVASLKVIQDGTTATRVGRTIVAGNKTVVGSFYVRATAAPVAQASDLAAVVCPSVSAKITMNTDGTVKWAFTGGSSHSVGGNLADSAWHRIDYKVDTSTTTFTLDVTIDGSAGTQSTLAGTIGDMTQWSLGSQVANNVGTFWYQDFVLSGTGADHPIGEHRVYPLYPSGEGTETLGSTNKIQDESAGQSALWSKVDDWNTSTPNTSDYVTYASTTLGDAASNFAEFTFQDPPSGITVWDVIGIIAGFASGTGADTADTQVLTAHGGTLIDHIGNLIDYSGSASVLGYYRQKLARPSGGWDDTKLAAAVVQWGRSTDTNAIPRLSAVMIEYAAPEVNGTATPAACAAVGAVPTPTKTADANVGAPTTVAAIAAVPAPTIVIVTPDATATPSAVAAIGAVPAPTITAAAVATPSAAAAVSAVNAPTITASALVTPSVVAAISAVNAPTVAAAALVAPSTVAAVVTVFAETTVATATVTPAAVAGVASVGSPDVAGGSFLVTGATETVAGVGTPTVTADALTDAPAVTGVAAVPSPVVVVGGFATATPATVVAIARVPAPTVTTEAEQPHFPAVWFPTPMVEPVMMSGRMVIRFALSGEFSVVDLLANEDDLLLSME